MRESNLVNEIIEFISDNYDIGEVFTDSQIIKYVQDNFTPDEIYEEDEVIESFEIDL
jgi:hypothetical protein